MEVSKVDQELVARTPDLHSGGGMNGEKVKDMVVLVAEVEEVMNQERKIQENPMQKREAPENQSERALMKGGCNGEVNGNLLEDDFEDFEEREDDEDYFQDENIIGSEVLLTEVEEGVIEERKEQENTTREMEAPETLSENANMEGGGDEEAHENLHENETGVVPSPCFSNFLARTTFVLESLPEAKNPGQDAIFGDFVFTSSNS